MMKLFNVKLTTLKSKLYAIVFASFVVRVVAFFALPNTPSSLGPDEGTYAAAANWTALGKPATEFPDFGAGLYASGRSLILPAAALNKIGFNPLDSVRLTASVYGFLALLLTTRIILKTAHKYASFAQFSVQRPRIFFNLFLVFTFLPSHFAWSILGLRESASEFWVMCVFALLFQILHLCDRATFLNSSGFLLSIIMVFSARPQVGWVLGLTLLIYLSVRIKASSAKILLPLALLGITLGYVATVPTSIETNTRFAAKLISNIPNISPSAISNNEEAVRFLCESDGQEITFKGDRFLCKLFTSEKTRVTLNNPVTLVAEQADVFPMRHEANKLGADSAIELQTCPVTIKSRVDKYICIAYRVPFTTYTFLFRPILGADVTSRASFGAAAENLFWLGSFLYIAFVFTRNRRLAFIDRLAPSLIFMILYSVAAGAYEGNMGTAFRHKALTLWIVLLLIGSSIGATQERLSKQRKIKVKT